MDCSACGAPAKPGQRFCTSCGAALALACRACGAQNPASSRFCGNCGSALGPVPETHSPEGELRPVTVLFADLSGFTALASDRDPEDVQRLLNDFFAVADGVIVRFGGTIDKHIGDCVMAVFGAPIAHGDDAERAVAAAIGISEGLTPLAARYNAGPLEVHCGLAAGTVLAGSTGSDAHRPYTITGSSVNLAARLCDLAKRGEILLSDDLAAATAHRYSTEAIGSHRLEGFAEELPVFRLSRTEQIRRDMSAPSFVGREAEVRQIDAQLDITGQEGTGRIVYIRGDAGIGKTRLLEEAATAARQRGFHCLSAAIMSFGAGSQAQLRRLVTQALLGIEPGLDDTQVASSLAAFVAENELGERDETFLHDLMGL
ncbi:MAG: hypothetical protein E6G87_08135, partial [Alphaproteobacteria bacterium]